MLVEPVSAAPLRAMRTPAATAFGVSLTGGAGSAAASVPPLAAAADARDRSRTSCWKTGSLVYWAMPMARVNGR